MARNFYVTLPVKDLKRSIDFFEELGQGFGLAFRKSADSDFFLLTRFENDARGCVHDGVRIVASLALPKVEDDEWFAVSFDCSAATGSVKEREPVIGIFDKTNDNVLPNPALRAWVIDLGARRFRPVPNVVCSSFT